MVSETVLSTQSLPLCPTKVIQPGLISPFAQQQVLKRSWDDTALVEQAALVWAAAADQVRTTTKNEVADASPVKGEELSTSGTGTR